MRQNWRYCFHLDHPNGNEPQDTWLGLYNFMILINDLEISDTTFNFVNDVMLTEIFASSDTEMQPTAEQVARVSQFK